MYRVTVLIGILLGITGIVGFYQTEPKDLLALIPSFIGIPLFVCGIIAAKEAMRMMAMHIAILIGLVGFIGATATFFKDGQPIETKFSWSITALLCATFVGLCVRSFIQARKAREATEAGEPEVTE